MKRKLLKALANSSLVRNFVEKPSPRWMVFLADLLLIAFSCALTLAIGHDSGSESLYATQPAKALVAFIVYIGLALLLRTSRYIIRLSVLEDTYRLVELVVVASLVLGIHYLLKIKGLRIDAAKEQLRINRKNISRRVDAIRGLEDVKKDLTALLKSMSKR